MIRTLTWRGFRATQPQVALPRETQAAAKAIQTVESMTPKIVEAAKSASTPAAAEVKIKESLSEAFAATVLDLAIKRDPHVSMYGWAIIDLSDSQATVPMVVDIFDPPRAPGAPGSGVWGVYNNLITPHKPLKPCLIHNIGCFVNLKSTVQTLHALQGLALKLKRGKDSIFEIPLLHALLGVVFESSDGENLIADVETLAGGGAELEGHGAPFLLSEDISLTIEPGMPLVFDQLDENEDGKVLISVRVDGEALEL